MSDDLAGFVLERISETELLCSLYGPRSADPTGRVSALLRRECVAMRRIVELHSGTDFAVAPGRHLCGDSKITPEQCPTMRAIAMTYADHPDFRPEWAATEEQQ